MQTRNTAVSLRGMARKLAVSPSYLSMVLSGKRDLTRTKAKDFAKRLGIKAEREQLFMALWQLETAKSDLEKDEARESLSAVCAKTPITSLEVDTFKLISEWHHGAILESLDLKNQSHAISALAHRLGITTYEAEFSLQRLERMGLVKKVGRRFSKSHQNLSVTEIPSSAIRKYHKELLDRKSVV